MRFEITDDFLVDGKEGEWIGIVVSVGKKHIYILNKKAHTWLQALGDVFIGFQKETTK